MPDPAGPEREPASIRGWPRDRIAASDRERPAVHDHLARPTPTVRIAGRDRWPAAWAGLIGLFLVGALLKPWDGPSLAPASVGPAPAVVPAPAPSAGPDRLAGLREHCQDPLGWRVYSRELWIGREVRTWRSVEPVARASGPTDPSIPVVPLGPFVDALGYCSPWTGSERPPDDARVSGWHLDPAARGGDGLTVVPLRTIAPDDPTVLGALFGALTGSGSASPAAAGPATVPVAAPAGPATGPGAVPARTGWPSGRYVFALRATGWERWWAVQVARRDEPLPDAALPSGRPATDQDGTPAGGPTSP